VGGILAAERAPQLLPAAGLVVASLAWDQLFLVYDVLPATIPPALVLLAVEGWRRRGTSQPDRPLRRFPFNRQRKARA
jgi:hypothetical protein